MARKSGSSTTVTHAKLHKRDHSSSTVGSPGSPYSPEIQWTGISGFDDGWSEKTGTKISASKGLPFKPYLRKLSLKDHEGIDLSRPAAENEGLAGLGINDYSMGPRSVSDVTFASLGGRNKHHRTASNTSQLSSSSSARPSMPYVHPMRQTPRPYTPPVTKSYTNSMHGGDDVTEAFDVLPDEDLKFRQLSMEPVRRSGSISSTTAPLPPLSTSHSFTKLGTHSQSSLSIASPIATRPRGDTLRSQESTTTSPSSRPSLEKFGFLRGRDSPVDPLSRANEIRLARQAYKEKEEAKDRKIEQEARRRAERDARKAERKEERLRQQMETGSSKRSLSISNEKLQSSVVAGRDYNDFRPAHERSMPARVDTNLSSKRTHSKPDVSKTKQARSRWLAFITWFRTRLLRVGRKFDAK